MSFQTSTSPLRYPGGKQRLAPVLQDIIRLNKLEGCSYAEPFAGGAGVALNLLFNDFVSEIHLNDLDPAICAFWNCALDRTEELVRRITDTPVTMETWQESRRIYRSNEQYAALDLAFATFFLNRTNRSGIIRGGVIGGKHQTGRWKLDARFNKPELVRRIEKLAGFRERIHVHNLDAAFFIPAFSVKLRGDNLFAKTVLPSLVYLDPPYYLEGTRLYRNHYTPKDHKRIAAVIRSGVCPNWIVSYDNVAPALEAYDGCKRLIFELNHSAHQNHFGSEVMFIAEHLALP